MELNIVHNSPLKLARNILLLKIFTRADFNPEDESNLAYLWDVWYRCVWTDKQTRLHLIEDLKQLINGDVPAEDSLVPLQSDELQAVRQIWMEWLQLLQSNLPPLPWIESLHKMKWFVHFI